jgi:hypothetical protein
MLCRPVPDVTHNSNNSGYLDVSIRAGVADASGEVQLVDTATGQSASFCVSTSNMGAARSHASFIPAIFVRERVVFLLCYVLGVIIQPISPDFSKAKCVRARKGLALPRARHSGEIALSSSRRLRSTLVAAPVL